VLRLVAVVSNSSRMILKSPRSSHATSLRQYIVYNSVRKSFFQALSTGP
jgi:hypothetical protein